jgi:hypothetical protein
MMMDGDGRIRTDIRLGASEALCQVELHPQVVVQRGRVESNHHSRRRQGYSLLSSPVLSVRETIEGGRPGSNRRRGDHNPECCRYTTATMERGRPDSNRRPLT